MSLTRHASTTAAERSSRAPAAPLLAFFVFFVFIVGLQWTQGAYQAEFGGHPDEAAHYVTGLMVRDYLAAGLPPDPMRFAQAFYDHYPKVALGNWPPLFYVIQSGWTLLLTPSRASVLLLMATLAALLALITMRALIAEFGQALALFGGLLVLALPLVQQHAAMVMAEVPVALFALLATLHFGRYLDRGLTGDSVASGLFASAAILTKGSGLALGLVPVLAIVFTGRFDVLARRNFWYPVPIIAVLGAPWTWAFSDVARGGWQEKGVTLDYMQRAAPQFPTALIGGASLVVGAFAIVGFVTMLVAVRRRTTPQRWAAPAALVLAVLVFHAIVPASLDSRHLIQALPAWAMFSVAGIAWTAGLVATRHPRLRWAVYAVAIAGFLHTASQSPGKHCAGFRRVVEDVVSRQDTSAVFLVSSDATGEGMFIAETAMADDRPGHVVRRASKLLASQSWSGSAYHAKVHGADDLIALLKQERIRVIVIDTTIPASLLAPHHTVLRTTAESSSRQFALRRTYPVIRDYQVQRPGSVFQDGIRVYEMRDAVPTTTAEPPGTGQ